MNDRPSVVLIPAHGLGSRLRDVTLGRAKTLAEVAGEPILVRLLRAVAADGGDRAVVSARPGDADVPACVAAHGGSVEVRRREPKGYLRDIMDIGRDLGEEFTVLDCDLVAPHAELTGFLASRSDPAVTMLFGVSAHPPSADPRSIRVIAEDGLMGLADPASSDVPRTIGAYHWRPPAVIAARCFLDAEGGSFHRYIGCLAARKPRIGLMGFSAALNVNTPAELELADRFVREWRQRGLE